MTHLLIDFSRILSLFTFFMLLLYNVLKLCTNVYLVGKVLACFISSLLISGINRFHSNRAALKAIYY